MRIVEKTCDGTAWITDSDNVFIWDGSQILQKRDSAGSVVERSYFGTGFEETSGDYYYTKDHLGSIREVVAANGTTIEAIYDYSPWGEVTKIGGTGMESDFLYTGHYWHRPSDLFLTHYRAYDPELGRWLSRDPIESIYGILAEFLPEGPNLYGYVGNNPVNHLDLYGLDVRYENTNAVYGLHQRISVDTGSGSFYGQSFGTTGGTNSSISASSEGLPQQGNNGVGMVYDDSRDPTRKVKKTLETTPTQDEKIKEWLDDDLGNTGKYNPYSNNCRRYSKRKFRQIKRKLKRGDFGE